MFPKRLLALTLFAAFAVMPPCVLRAQWQPTNGPWGGLITAIAFDDSNIYAGTYQGGIFRSTDHGSSWFPVNTGFNLNTDVTSLMLSGDNLIAGVQEGGTLLSSDHGASWKGISGVGSLNSFVSYGGILFGGGDGVFRSTDNGLSWFSDSSDLQNLAICSFATNGKNLYAGTNKGVYLSTDSGDSWTSLGRLSQNQEPEIVFEFGHSLFVGTSTTGVSRSTDSGKSWTPQNLGLPEITNVIAFVSSGTNLYAASSVSGAGGVFLSTDNGEGWSATDSAHLAVEGVSTLNLIGNDLFAGNGSGVFISSDGGANWNLSNRGINAFTIQCFAEIGTYLFAGTYGGGVFLSTDSGTNWSAVNNGLPASGINAIAVSGTTLIAANDLGAYASKDSGANWYAADSGLPAFAGVIFDPVLSLDVVGTNIFAGTDSGVYLSTNNGTNWGPANGGLLSNAWIHSIAVSSDYIFADVYRVDSVTVARSSDNGISWANVSTGLTSFEDNVNALAVSGSYVYAACGSGVFRSSNSGTSWLASGNGIQRGYVATTLAVSGESLFVSGYPSDPLYFSNDSGNSWSDASSGLQENTLLNALQPTSTYLFAGTQGAGVWRRPLSDFNQSGVTESALSNNEIQIYPNPFTQSTQITFTSQAAGYAEVSIVNMLGVEVARLFSGELGAGEHSFNWDAADGTSAPRAPQGVYECAVRMNGQVETVPVVLMR